MVSMFQSATFKLTAWYLLIIMALSLAFSVALYHASEAELGRRLTSQERLYQQLLIRPYVDIEQLRMEQLEQARNVLKSRLAFINLCMLALGGAVSYLLARKTLKPLEESMELQGRFTSDASHELRTPLTAMQTEIEVALRDPGLSKTEAKALLQSNLEEVKKLHMLSDSLLKLTAMNGNGLDTRNVNLKKVTAEAIKRVKKSADTKQIAIYSQSNTKETITIMGDEHSLVEAVVILLDNAVKYSPSGTSIAVEYNRHGRHAEVKVTDHGAGIKGTELPYIFERFYRGDPARSKNGQNGYGLGLSIAKKIVEQHEGDITVKSTTGKGSVFTIVLPLA